MTTVRREPLADQAAELLLSRIRAGEWALGAKLPGETTLAPQLGVGRSTVREAIRQLAGRGVLTSRQGAGVFVAALDAPEDWSRVVGRADIRAVLEARLAIEVEASALAAVRRTPAEVRALRAALDRRAAHRSDIEEHVDTDAAFHRVIVAASHNPLLLEMFDGFTPRSREAMIAMLRARGGRGGADAGRVGGGAAGGAGGAGDFRGGDADHEVHERIADAIVDRDGERAAALTRGHLTSLLDQLTA